MTRSSHSGARSSAGEHYLDMVGVTGSIPVAPTSLRLLRKRLVFRGFLLIQSGTLQTFDISAGPKLVPLSRRSRQWLQFVNIEANGRLASVVMAWPSRK